MSLALRMLPIALLFAFPLVAAAQSAQPSDEMKSAVMTQILRDPRAAQIPPEQLQALVNALAQKAEAQKVPAIDVMWQPATYTGEPVAPQDALMPGDCDYGFMSTCSISEALGFAGDDALVIPLVLLAGSGLLILLIVRMKKHHHEMGHFAPVSTARAAPTSPGQSMQA
jgi:hypothetical protein